MENCHLLIVPNNLYQFVPVAGLRISLKKSSYNVAACIYTSCPRLFLLIVIPLSLSLISYLVVINDDQEILIADSVSPLLLKNDINSQHSTLPSILINVKVCPSIHLKLIANQILSFCGLPSAGPSIHCHTEW